MQIVSKGKIILHSSLFLLFYSVLLLGQQYFASLVPHRIQEPEDKQKLHSILELISVVSKLENVNIPIVQKYKVCSSVQCKMLLPNTKFVQHSIRIISCYLKICSIFHMQDKYRIANIILSFNIIIMIPFLQ